MNRSGLDPEAMQAAIKAVEEFGYGNDAIEFNADELAEVAVEAYMNDLVRQLADLSPCEDCEKEDQDGSASEAP